MRRLVALAALIVAFAVISVRARAGDPPDIEATGARLLRAGPLLGHAGADAIWVWAMPETPEQKLEVVVSLPGEAGSEPAERRVAMSAPAAGARATSVRIDGLVPGATYGYRVLVEGQDSDPARGSFRLPPRPGTKLRAKLGVVSCMHARRHPTQVAWAPLVAQAPDLLVHLGDAIYANSTDPETVRSWYTAQRRISGYSDAIRLTPTVAIWDDHDFGMNDGDGTLIGKERSLATFREMWPGAGTGSGTKGGEGVCRQISFGDVELFLLDVRYNRVPNGAPDDEDKTIVGRAQLDWLERGLRASKATFKLVCSGSTISAGFKDHWRNYPRDRRRLLALTKEIPGMVFLTGDIHTSLVARGSPEAGVGYPIYEVVSSGVAVNITTHYFTIIDVDTVADDPELRVRIFEIDGSGQQTACKETVIRRSELNPAF